MRAVAIATLFIATLVHAEPHVVYKSHNIQHLRLGRRQSTGGCNRGGRHGNVTISASSSAERVHKSSSAPASKTSSAVTSTKSSSWKNGGGLIGFSDDKCGKSGATSTSSKDAGPNGSEEFLDCGISQSDPSSGWTPPSLTLDQIKTISLDEALAMDNSPFSACSSSTIELFKTIGESVGLPPILLASFAMQESSCNPNASGDNGGAFGLMQITQDKCGSAPGGNCAEPEYNVKTAANYFVSTLESVNHDLLQAIGTYNGWYVGMSYTAANAVGSSCCECKNNLDYLHQMLNFWLLGMDGSSAGTFRNLDNC